MFELGNNLREARQRRRIDLVIAEQDTKIRSKYLAALETEEFDVLPGPVFVRGFLRTYARYLGLDPQLFVDEYNERFGRFEEAEEHVASPALGRPGLAQERAARGRRATRGIVVLTLVVLALLAWLGLRQDSSRDEGRRTPAATTTVRDEASSSDASSDAVGPGSFQSAADAAAAPSGAAASTGRATTATIPAR
ncbi:MAG: hypothetical protein JWM86_507 [Thermoleophilia bacterium]|nr:hypothetical protein [Thermoleophilia bacterium]